MVRLVEILQEQKDQRIDLKKWKEYISKYPMLHAAVDVLDKLSAHGNAYIVGGAVRDIVSGDKVPDDVDIATDVPMHKIENIFHSYDIGKNKQFGIVVIKHMGHDFEIAQFREDGKYFDGRRPETIRVGVDFETDAGRRDFTINAMGVDKDGRILDYFDGQKDIQNKVLRTVGNPEERFEEDYLRMLRAIRFASKMGYKIDPATMQAIQKHAPKIEKVASERVMKELIKMASQKGKKFAGALELLKKAGLLKYIVPELVELEKYEHTPETHPEGPDVWSHVIAALEKNDLDDPIVNLAIALHDVGKIRTRSYDDVTGRVKYLDHAKASVDIIEELSKRLKMDNETKEALIFAAENHMKAHDLFKMRESYVVNLIMNKNWDVLYNVAYADVAARGHLFDEERWGKTVERIARLTQKYKDHQEMQKVRKVVSGDLVMKLRGLSPGPKVGKCIKATIEWILDNNVDINDTERIVDYIKGLEL